MTATEDPRPVAQRAVALALRGLFGPCAPPATAPWTPTREPLCASLRPPPTVTSHDFATPPPSTRRPVVGRLDWSERPSPPSSAPPPQPQPRPDLSPWQSTDPRLAIVQIARLREEQEAAPPLASPGTLSAAARVRRGAHRAREPKLRRAPAPCRRSPGRPRRPGHAAQGRRGHLAAVRQRLRSLALRDPSWSGGPSGRWRRANRRAVLGGPACSGEGLVGATSSGRGHVPSVTMG